MARKKHSAEQIVAILRQIEVEVANHKPIGQACREAGITEQTNKPTIAGTRRFAYPQIWGAELSSTRVLKRPTFQKPRSGGFRCMAASGSAAILVSPVLHRSR